MADTPKVYVLCDANCKWEGMTKEQILSAIVQAVREGTISDVDTGFVQTIRTINNVPLKFFAGTQAEYERLTDEDKVNLYAIITNDATIRGINAAIEELREGLDSLYNSLYESINNVRGELQHLEDDLTDGYITVGEAAKATNADNVANGYYRKVIWDGWVDNTANGNNFEINLSQTVINKDYVVVRYGIAPNGAEWVYMETPPMLMQDATVFIPSVVRSFTTGGATASVETSGYIGFRFVKSLANGKVKLFVDVSKLYGGVAMVDTVYVQYS